MLIINIINFLAAIAVIFFGCKLWRARLSGKKLAELKPLIYSFASSLAILWVINVFTGFII